jgi:HlyD family secretion protein
MKLSPLIALTVLASLSGCGQKSEPATAPAPKAALTITTAPASQHTLARAIEAQGQIAPWQEAVISAKVNGLSLTELNVEIGDKVKRGQLLAKFDTRAVTAELAQARANLAQATANARQTVANRDRIVRMQGKGAISEQDLQLADTQVEMADAQREMAQAQLNALEIRLNDCEVRAVDDGVISARTATLGQVAPAGTELFRLIRQERLEWQAQLNPQQLAQITPGLPVTITLTDGSKVEGKVRQLAPALENQSRLGVAFIALDNNGSARAGMFASGLIRLDEKLSLVVPAEAVVLRDGRSTVFRVDNSGMVTQIDVDTGRREGGVIEIRRGLADSETVAVRGAGFLVDGDRVRIADLPPATAITDASLSD